MPQLQKHQCFMTHNTLPALLGEIHRPFIASSVLPFTFLCLYLCKYKSNLEMFYSRTFSIHYPPQCTGQGFTPNIQRGAALRTSLGGVGRWAIVGISALGFPSNLTLSPSLSETQSPHHWRQASFFPAGSILMPEEAHTDSGYPIHFPSFFGLSQHCVACCWFCISSLWFHHFGGIQKPSLGLSMTGGRFGSNRSSGWLHPSPIRRGFLHLWLASVCSFQCKGLEGMECALHPSQIPPLLLQSVAGPH